MADATQAFYDELAESYHLLFADWPGSMQRQAAALDRLIRASLGEGPHGILDAACGIGAQAIGLALLGYRVHATDLSPRAVARAEREAAKAGAALTFAVADLRTLAAQVHGEFDVVLACDNALPHFLSDEDLRLAVANMTARLRPGGLFLASTRYYDRLVREQPRVDAPRVFDDPDGLRITFQLWQWTADMRRYALHQFILKQEGEAWRTAHFTAEYRALLRAELEQAIRKANLVEARWHEPEESGFFQPIITARRP